MMELPWVKNGILFGVLSIILSVAMVYFLPINIMWLSLLSIVFLIYFLIKTGREERALNEGFLSYGKILLPLTYMLLLGAFISFIFNLILNAVMPDFGERMVSKILESTSGMMESFGAPADQIDEQMEAMEAETKEMLTLKGQILNFFKGGIMYFVVAAIAAIFLKKDKPEQNYL